MLSLDEIALKKGHGDFVTVVTARLAHERVVLLGVLPDREKATVVAFLRSIPQRLCLTIHTVCCDMYEGFTEPVREELPSARIVVDRFHVTRHYHQAADGLRQSELKRLKQELPKEEYQLIKGSMWAFRKLPEDLRPEERQVLHKLWQVAPKLRLAYDLRRQLTAIFEQRISQAVALLCRSSQQRLCRRVEQQAQSLETALLWHFQSGPSFSTHLPGSGRLPFIRLATTICGLITAIPKEPIFIFAALLSTFK